MMFVKRWVGLPKEQRDRFGIAAAIERDMDDSNYSEGFAAHMAASYGRLVEMLYENDHLTGAQVRELVGAGYEEVE